MATDPNQKVNTYNLGEPGVNLSKSPLHIEDGELVSAQNAEFFLDEGIGAIRKRLGLQKLNGIALAGAVRGVIGVPLTAPGARSIYAQRPGTPWFRKTTDGTTWADTAGEFTVSPLTIGSAYSVYPMARAVMLNSQFYYSSRDGSSNGRLMAFDGSVEYEVARFLTPTAFRVLCPHNGKVVLTEGTRVWLFDPIAGTMTQIGDAFTAPDEVLSAVSYLGKVWVGTATGTTGKLYYARETDTAWTNERTAAAGHKAYVSLVVYDGSLYAGTAVSVLGTSAIVEKRTVAGVWSTSQTGSSTAALNNFDGMVVMDAKLYAAYFDQTTVCEIQRFDGAAWTQSKNLFTETPSVLGVSGVVVVGTSLFYNTFDASNAFIYRKVATAGAWAKVDTTIGTVTQGVMAVI